MCFITLQIPADQKIQPNFTAKTKKTRFQLKNPQNPDLHISINAKKASNHTNFSQKRRKKSQKVKKRQIF
jgi:hypothetical protein